jgi:hypothetical protein
VAYHETFWVVAGTAAPVIALAAVVTVSSTSRAVAEAAENFDGWATLRATAGPIIAYVAAGIDIVWMANLLGESLGSLGAGTDSTSIGSAIFSAEAGLFLLLFAAVAPIAGRMFSSRTDAELPAA